MNENTGVDSSTMIEAIINASSALFGWEGLAMMLGIVYVILAARESLWCWPAAFFSTIIYTVLFWEGQLPMQALLNFYYMGMAIYGFILWKKHAEKDDELTVLSWPLTQHILIISLGMVVSLSIGYYLDAYTETRLPYLDAVVMVFSVITTWLLAQKILQNWLYWVVIDTVAIGLYWQTGYYVTIILFVVYVILSIYGYQRWRKHGLAERVDG